MPSEDCLKIAELIGVKTMLNEFVAFQRLGALIKDSAIYKNYSGSGSSETILANGSWVFTGTNGVNYTFEYGVLYVSLTLHVLSHPPFGTLVYNN